MVLASVPMITKRAVKQKGSSETYFPVPEPHRSSRGLLIAEEGGQNNNVELHYRFSHSLCIQSASAPRGATQSHSAPRGSIINWETARTQKCEQYLEFFGGSRSAALSDLYLTKRQRKRWQRQSHAPRWPFLVLLSPMGRCLSVIVCKPQVNESFSSIEATLMKRGS